MVMLVWISSKDCLTVRRVDLMRNEHITWDDIGLDYHKVSHGTMWRWRDETQYCKENVTRVPNGAGVYSFS